MFGTFVRVEKVYSYLYSHAIASTFYRFVLQVIFCGEYCDDINSKPKMQRSLQTALTFLLLASVTLETQAQNNIVADSECGSTKTCFSDCSSSSSSCNYQLACAVSSNTAQCSLAMVVAAGDVYIAWALSNDTAMGDDSVIGCKSISSQVSVFNSENQGPSPKFSSEYALEAGITRSSSSLANGIFRCEFTRPMTFAQGSRQMDLTQPWYWFLATGPLNAQSSTISYHQNRYLSNQKFDLSAAPATQSPVTPPSGGSLAKSSDCGSTKGCFSQCDSDSSCTFTVSWSYDSSTDAATYTISSNVGASASWSAIGFSADGDMGDDDVIGCLGLTDGSVRAFSAETTGRSTPEIYTDNRLVLVSGSVQDGTLTCTLRCPVSSYTVGSRTRRDIGQLWTLFFARGRGSLSNNAIRISYHTPNGRFKSSQALSAKETVDDSAVDEDFPLIKAHGALMIGAWVFFASIGIVAARYYKPVWKQDLCSQKVWFQIHRTCMILAFCACVAGFIIIFIEVGEWVEIEESPKYIEGHPIMGVIVTGLCVLNPLMALIRPHPGTKYRPIFNYAHWFVGTGAHILGVVTIFFGFEFDKADAPDYLKYILAGYVGWQALVELTLEMMACCCNKKARSEAYKMSDGHVLEREDANDEEDGMHLVRKVIFVVHFFVISALSAVLIALLIVGKEELDD